LPDGFGDLPAAARMADLSDARLLAVDGPTRYFAVPGVGETVCLVAISGMESTGTCAPRAALTEEGVYFAEGLPGDARSIALLVPDGVDGVVAGGTEFAALDNLVRIRTTAASLRFVGGNWNDHLITLPSLGPADMHSG